jgi:glycosyltransferase involved in cell wall biosynthesis
MLSICIPHYNFINDELFSELERQCLALAIAFEILIIDDDSEEKHKRYLKNLAPFYFKVIFLEQNVGRSKIRNLLAKEAKYPWLLFLDGDSTISDSGFIKHYLANLNTDIISGGRTYSLERPDNLYFLHWNYGIEIESESNAQFHSNNFAIKKEIFNRLNFDENITNYGYEDVVFGLEAKKLGFSLININNKVLHIGLKTNIEFLNDVEQALINLCEIEVLRTDLAMEEEVKILRNYYQIRSLKLDVLLSIFNSAIIKVLKKYLISSPKQYANQILSILKLYHLHQIKTYKK